MNLKQYIIPLVMFLCFLYPIQKAKAQCYPNKIVTAAYATGGTSPYKELVLWLTWGSTSQQSYPYGRHNRQLAVGSKSYASIPLGMDTYLCVEAEIIAISGGAVNSYAPGNYSGDSLDKLYNIGGSGTNNQLVSGIRNRENGETSILTLRAKASIDGEPVRIPGLVVADGESLADREHIYSTANGVWDIVEIRKNLNITGWNTPRAYEIKKNSLPEGLQEIQFVRGNDRNTGAVAFLKFNDDAYATNDLSVQFTTELKGGGLTALAIGLLTPNMDLGDAPESYGDPLHVLHNLEVTDDGILVNGPSVNINTATYSPGSLVATEGKFLGTTAPDADSGPMYSDDALGDDSSGPAGPNEEDAWPEEYQRFSYKSYYMPGNEMNAEIEYKNGEVGDKVSGWIDFDLNGTFDESERATTEITTAGNGSVILKWTVPPTRVPYNTFVRLRYFDSAEDHTNPTSNVNYGEVEDHKMYVLTPGGINPVLPSKALEEED